jgi:hypothetical protein
MPKSNPLERVPVAGVIPMTLVANSQEVANALASATLTGATASQMIALTQAVVTSTGATAAACVTFQLSGLNTNQISTGVLNLVFGVPAGAGVPAAPLVLNFNTPILGAPGGDITASLSALGTGHAGATIALFGKLTRAT